MPIRINADVKGKEYPPYTVTVERGRIKDFARAIGDLNSSYLDDRVGAASEWGDVIAPPTFPITFRDEGADTGQLLKDLAVIREPRVRRNELRWKSDKDFRRLE